MINHHGIHAADQVRASASEARCRVPVLSATCRGAAIVEADGPPPCLAARLGPRASPSLYVPRDAGTMITIL